MKRSLIALATFASIALVGCGGGGVETTPVAGTPAADVPTIFPMATSIAVQSPSLTASGGVAGLYQTPAQIRSRYGMDTLTSDAQQGSGQIIAVVTTYNNPTAAADLNKFSEANGLPTCAVVPTVYGDSKGNRAEIKPTAKLGDGCTIQVVNTDTNGLPAYGPNGCTKTQLVQVGISMVSTCVPGYEVYGPIVPSSGSTVWNAESSLDLQWAHAAAPKAKIVLIQANAPFPTALMGAVKFANSFANVVSMSWGGSETGLGTSFYGLDQFNNPNVTYVVASGDLKVPNWPATSNKVLAVGGTNDSSALDIGWSGSGGGLSTYYAMPTWQSGLGYAKRAMPDVAMVADKASPVNAVINGSWYGVYGTSVGAPIWAGIAAVTNAVRAEAGKSTVNFVQSMYEASAVPGTYTTVFGDVTTGSNNYTAKAGYDLVTGLGTPKTSALVSYMLAK